MIIHLNNLWKSAAGEVFELRKRQTAKIKNESNTYIRIFYYLTYEFQNMPTPTPYINSQGHLARFSATLFFDFLVTKIFLTRFDTL